MKDLWGYKDEFLSTKRTYRILRIFSQLPCMVCRESGFIEDGPFCAECYEKVRQLYSAPCSICGEDKRKCQCVGIRGAKDYCFLFWYDSLLSSELVAKIKYLGERRYVSFFGKLLANEIGNLQSMRGCKGVCYVPRSKENIRMRGFDQSKLLAESIAFYLGLPLIHCIKRSGRSEEQKKLSGEERLKNVKNKFSMDYVQLVGEGGEIPSKLLLVDDVVTTGSTVKECTFLLRKSGVRNVIVASIAKTPQKRMRKKRYRRKMY
jgi:competence protein ComFC